MIEKTSKLKTWCKPVASFVILIALSGCLGVPQGITPVEGFDGDRYMGKWYEIARIDNRFERGLTAVSAEYVLKENGTVAVFNRGYKAKKQKWEDIEGKALFVEEPTRGYLKVSFFGPIYGSYVVFELDHENYQYAFVSSNDRSYLWLLSRTPTIDNDLKAHFLETIERLDFTTDKLVWVDQSKNASQ